MSFNYPQQQQWQPRYNNGNYGGRGRYYANRNWQRSSGSPFQPDPRKSGNYTFKDDMVLSRSVQIISWMERRIICFYHAGVFYFGRKAIKLLENQAQFMLPVLQRVTNNYTQQQQTEGFSFGIVPHIGDSEKTVCVGQEEATWLLFNFLASNVFPITFEENEDIRKQDMFETPENEEVFSNIFGEAYGSCMQNPLNPSNYDAVVGAIGDLFEKGFLVSKPWERDYRRNYRSWTEPLEVGRQLQPSPVVPQQQQQQQQQPQ